MTKRCTHCNATFSRPVTVGGPQFLRRRFCSKRCVVVSAAWRRNTEILLTGEKGCTVCGEIKPIGRFSKNRSTKLGLAASCLTCSAVRTYIWKQLQKERQ